MYESPSSLSKGKFWWSMLAFYYYMETERSKTNKLILIAQLGGIWGFERVLQLGTGIVMQSPIARALWVPVVAGGVVAAVIDGEEGVENYVDYIDNVTSPEEPMKLQSAAYQAGKGVTAAVDETRWGPTRSNRRKRYVSYQERIIANLKAIHINNLRYQYTGSHAATSGPLFDINNPDQPNTFRPNVHPTPYLEGDEWEPYPV